MAKQNRWGWLLSFLFLGLIHMAFCLYSHQKQSASIKPRKFDKEAIDAFAKNSDFQYQEEQYEDSFWSALLHTLSTWLKKFFSHLDGNSGMNVLTIILYLIMGVAIFLLVYSLFKDGINAVILRKKVVSKIVFTEVEENLEITDLMALINSASREGNYKTAIRLWYIYLVRNLNDKGLIEWKKDKTNSQYLRELEPKGLRNQFRSITRIYEYVWFGDFTVDNRRYVEIESRFEKLNNYIGGMR